MKKWAGGLLCGLLVMGSLGAVEAQGDDGAAVTWIAAHAVPFETAEPQAGTSDLLPLVDLIGDADIVALGGATYTTHEFLALRDRITRLLVEEGGYALVAIESPLARARVINDYVRGADVDLAAELPTALTAYWRTQEVWDLIEWMRAYNLAQPEPVLGFYGLDAFYGDPVPIADVLAFVAEVNPLGVDWVEAQYACLDAVPDLSTSALLTVPLRQREACYESTLAVRDTLLAYEDEYTAATSAEAFAWAVREAYMVARGAEQITGEYGYLGTVRDEVLAENAVWLRAQASPDARLVIWAHNLTVGNFSTRMGGILRDRLDQNVVNVAMTFYAGGFQAFSAGERQTFEVAPARVGSYEALFYQVGLPRFILDLRAGRDDPGGGWLGETAEFRSIWSGYQTNAAEDSYYVRLRLAERYDLVIYFEESTPAHSLIGAE